MMKCREVSTLVSMDQLGDQPRRRRLSVWLHLMMCQHCRRFWRQVRGFDRTVRAIVVDFEQEKPVDLERRVMEQLSRPSKPADSQ